MKPANLAPVYIGVYPALAELCREHGYALAVHGSCGRDFDLVAVPWTQTPSSPEVLVSDITTKFSFESTSEPKTKEHGRLCWTMVVSFGDAFLDFSVMPTGDELEKTRAERDRFKKLAQDVASTLEGAYCAEILRRMGGGK